MALAELFISISYTLEKNRYDFSLDLNIPSELLSVTVLAEIEYQVAAERKSEIHAWQMVYWRTVQKIEWSPSVEYAHCHVA